MNEPDFNSQAVNAYLLGTLAAEETERFDELSFTDDSFADTLKAAENELIDAYLSGALSGAALTQFEANYLASPHRREKVEFAAALQKFAEKTINETEKAVAIEPKPKSFFAKLFSDLNIFAAPNPVLQWSFAALALMFVVLGGWLWLQNARLNQQSSEILARRDELLQRERELQNQLANEQTANAEKERELARVAEERERLEAQLKSELEARKELEKRSRNAPAASPQIAGQTTPQQQTTRAISVASFVLTPPLRGTVQNLTIPPQTDFVAIALQLETNDFSAYRVVLENQSGASLWRSGKLRAAGRAENKILNLRFPAKLLKSEVYSLTVAGVKTTGEVEIITNYPFRAVVK